MDALINPRIQSWQNQLVVIDRDIIALTHRRRMFHEIMEIIRSNPRLAATSVVYGWMIDAYVAATTVAVRTQVDTDNRVISFVRLLEDIAAFPNTITRPWFVSRYRTTRTHVAETDFDRFDPRGLGHVDPEVVQSDLDRLQNEARAVEAYVNNYVAHRNREIALGQLATPPRVTWGELDRVIDLLGELLQRYTSLLNQQALVSVELQIGQHWREVFRHPWIEEGGTRE